MNDERALPFHWRWYSYVIEVGGRNWLEATGIEKLCPWARPTHCWALHEYCDHESKAFLSWHTRSFWNDKKKQYDHSIYIQELHGSFEDG